MSGVLASPGGRAARRTALAGSSGRGPLRNKNSAFTELRVRVSPEADAHRSMKGVPLRSVGNLGLRARVTAGLRVYGTTRNRGYGSCGLLGVIVG